MSWKRIAVADPVQRVLMTVDAVGGVWRYALSAARGLAAHGIAVRLLGMGPPPGSDLAAEVATIPGRHAGLDRRPARLDGGGPDGTRGGAGDGRAGGCCLWR